MMDKDDKYKELNARDMIAIQAMNGELACQNSRESYWTDYEGLARHCFGIADAMIKESNRKRPNKDD